MENIKPGIYRHFKGKLYEVIGTGTDSETEETKVIYRSLETGETWLRPASMWSEIVVQGNYNGPRFTEISLQNDIMQNQENMYTSEISEFSADERREAAIAYFKQGCNCTQAVLAAYSDRIGIDFTTAMKLGASFGGGMGRLREVCGAVSGMFAVIGLMQGYSVPGDIEGKKKHYALIQELAGKFKDIHGSIVCRELLGLGKGPDSPVPEARTGEYYKKRPCAEIIGDAAYIISNYVDNQTSEN